MTGLADGSRVNGGECDADGLGDTPTAYHVGDFVEGLKELERGYITKDLIAE